MAVEDGMREEGRKPAELAVEDDFRLPTSDLRLPAGERPEHRLEFFLRHPLVERDADLLRVHLAKVDAGFERLANDLVCVFDAHRDRVEEVLSREVADPRSFSCAASHAAARCTRRAMSRRPSGPCHTAYMPAITASRTCAVQMLLVAFSRRMCCSRVCSERRRPAWPCASFDTPTSRPGIRRFSASFTDMKAACGPPNPSGTPKRWRIADADVGAEFARGLQQASARANRRKRRRARPPCALPQPRR